MIVYVLTNEAMPGLVKIGRTEAGLAQRMKQLDTCGVPLPFQCYYAATVNDSMFVESRLHIAFGDYRIRATREFFKLDPLRAKAALEIAAIEDVTPKSDVINDPEDRIALVKAQQRASAFSFPAAQIRNGEQIHFAKDFQITARVIGDRSIEFEGKTESLTGAAMTILQRMGYHWTSVQGPQYWMFEDETLAERRARLDNEAPEQTE